MRNTWRYNTGDTLRVVETGEIGTVIGMGQNEEKLVYMLKIPGREF
jgi:hypothetical protein